MEIARRHGLKVKALMSVGHPGESEDTIRATRDWLLEVRPADFDATVITTYPGTPYFDEAVETQPGVWTYTCAKSGDRLHSLEVDYREVSEYYKGVPGEYTSYVYTDHLTAADLVEQRDALEAAVRHALGIPYNAGAAALRYEHSMGQGVIPSTILRSTSYASLRTGVSRTLRHPVCARRTGATSRDRWRNRIRFGRGRQHREGEEGTSRHRGEPQGTP